MEELEFYSAERITDRIYIFTENYSMVNRLTIGVIVGDDRTAVIDSGLGGDGRLREEIEAVTGKKQEMICFLTDGLADHAGGTALFDEVRLCSLDRKMAAGESGRENRLRMIDAYALYNREVHAFSKTHMIDAPVDCFENVQEGMSFDLGGITIEAKSLEGPTPGHMVYYVPSENILFCGDAINRDVHLEGLDKGGLARYQNDIEKIAGMTDIKTRLYSAHLNRSQEQDILYDLASCAEDIREDNTEQDPPGESIYFDCHVGPNIRMHYHGNVCIIYDRNHVE